MFERYTEEEAARLAQGFELITQGLHEAQDGDIDGGAEQIRTGLVMLKPTDNMRPPVWMDGENIQVGIDLIEAGLNALKL
jgi:hypothetical protein